MRTTHDARTRQIKCFWLILHFSSSLLLSFATLSSGKQAHPDLSNIKVNKLGRFVCNVSSKVAPDKAVPNRGVHLLKLLTNSSRDLLFGVIVPDGFLSNLQCPKESENKKRKGGVGMRCDTFMKLAQLLDV